LPNAENLGLCPADARQINVRESIRHRQHRFGKLITASPPLSLFHHCVSLKLPVKRHYLTGWNWPTAEAQVIFSTDR
jgi:hypothetical protein